LGTNEQVAGVLAFLRQHESSGGSDVTPVLELLRADLRRELALGPAKQGMRVFRFRDSAKATPAPSVPRPSRDVAV
jgi:hypothetical protein